MARTTYALMKNKTEFQVAQSCLNQTEGAHPLPRRQVHREMMANDGQIAEGTLFEPERLAAR